MFLFVKLRSFRRAGMAIVTDIYLIMQTSLGLSRKHGSRREAGGGTGRRAGIAVKCISFGRLVPTVWDPDHSMGGMSETVRAPARPGGDWIVSFATSKAQFSAKSHSVII
jgi:hypothetical protein